MANPSPGIAILGAGIFVKTQYIPRLAEISDLVVLKAIWSRTEVTFRAMRLILGDVDDTNGLNKMINLANFGFCYG